MPLTLQTIPEVDWGEFLPHFYREWDQGEHVSCIGPTGTGKTTLCLQILERRRLVTVFANKPRDDTMRKLVKTPGWKKVTEWNPKPGEEKLVLWPKGRDMSSYEKVQATEYLHALQQIWDLGCWCVFFDEVRYICDNLKLRRVVELFWQQARALKVSIVACTQRPAYVPVLMFDQATHLFFWCDNDDYNLKRIGGLGALNAKLIREEVAGLERHQVLYLNTRTGEMLKTRPTLEKPK